ncbi:TPA: AAA family ATPase [Pseudomonas aeruginosa]|uniref:ATP-dependent nuclease n=1 Tax=Pseudomonas TaxID=286 RepID=UPI00157249E2|nr:MULTISPECIES: AAA family ATPase [Pseudomonas]MBI8031501.1 AAA family ATPase [Pseudomonas aeruginosa]NTU01921.1 AAA family ATPase [Pseudomonas aeruginosa]NTU08202.1 AAA family ATPase [Pseudomonas aeruginosa]UZX34605.1 AAA family ATPase [Pseudomonas sp. B111]HBO5774646.1 ATP-binding protein [Pseudomonas aeruginosa]
MATTRLKNIHIKKFRALEDVQFDLGTQITVVCGKNGTSKSSILGIAAQVFSFETNPVADQAITNRTLTGDPFKSFPAEHFRFSEIYDIPGSMDVNFTVHDGYTEKDVSPDLRLIQRKGSKARPVVRNNTSIPGKNTSRNLTHPVIYLSLKRLMPIAVRDKYEVKDNEYLTQNRAKFVQLNNELLNKRSTNATATIGTIKSAVAHGTNYDQDSVSAGEDNAGQIVLALMSFRRLKEEYPDYKGGLLLIDEADAGLFPAAQTKLLDILVRECNELNIQVLMTSHSPTIIEHIHSLSQKYQRRFKTIYLSDTYGKVQCLQDKSWIDIYADLMTQTIPTQDELSIPKVNIYFEDREGSDFFNELLFRHSIKQLTNPLSDISLGCGNYLHLIKHKIPEFTYKSIIVLDGDVEQTHNANSIILLPGELPPDQLLFEFLYNLPAADVLWQNKPKYTKPVFDSVTRDIINALNITGDTVNLSEALSEYYEGIHDKTREKESEKLRKLFKAFYKNEHTQKLLKLRTKQQNPWKRWIADNQQACQKFKDDFIAKFRHTLDKGFGVEPGILGKIDGL